MHDRGSHESEGEAAEHVGEEPVDGEHRAHRGHGQRRVQETTRWTGEVRRGHEQHRHRDREPDRGITGRVADRAEGLVAHAVGVDDPEDGEPDEPRRHRGADHADRQPDAPPEQTGGDERQDQRERAGHVDELERVLDAVGDVGRDLEGPAAEPLRVPRKPARTDERERGHDDLDDVARPAAHRALGYEPEDRRRAEAPARGSGAGLRRYHRRHGLLPLTKRSEPRSARRTRDLRQNDDIRHGGCR